MSSLNDAFIKAYGRERAAQTETTAPTAPTLQPPAAPVLGNWYNADTWYRAEAAPAQATVPAPHAPTVSAYQPPTVQDLSCLIASANTSNAETEYRLAATESIRVPELVIEEEPALDPLPARVIPAAKISHPSPAPIMAPVVTPDFDQLFASVQVTTGWESSLGYLPAVTTAGPVPVLVPPPKAAAPKPAPQAAPEVERTIVQTPAPAPVAEKPTAPANIERPRLDAAASPVPKPHTSFAAVESATAIKLKIAEASIAAIPQAATAPPAKPEPAPLGLLQPAWEVDRFQWPDHCRQLLNTANEYLADVGTRLSTAARDGLNILGITSTRRGEGRTTLALCLARAAADAGVKVALVDCDLDNPQLVNELGVEASCGWHEVIQGKQPLAEAAIVSLEDKFAFFPWTTSSVVKSLNDPRATRALRQIAKAYSLVILDLGPVPGRETKLFEDGENCPIDAAILVRDLRWTSALEAQRVAAQLTAAGVESVGIAENFGPRAQQAA